MIRWIAGVGLVALALSALYAQALAAPGFVADQTLSPDGADVPEIAFAPNGYGIVAWNQYNGGPSAIDVSVRPPGGAWSAPQALDASSMSKSELSVAIDAAGEAAVAWEDSVDQGSAQAVVATRPAGAVFGAPEMLADGSAGKAFHPAVGIDEGGRVTLLYDRSPDVAERMFAVGSSALAVAPRVVSAGCETDQMQLAVAPSGDAVAAFRCGGAVFALRRAGSWAVSPIVADSATSCPAPTTFGSRRGSRSTRRGKPSACCRGRRRRGIRAARSVGRAPRRSTCGSCCRWAV